VKNTFEENDAGFQHIINQKGQAVYEIHNQLMLGKVKSARTSIECTELLFEWLKFFRSAHIGIERLTNEAPQTSQTKQVMSEMWNVDIPQFENYISTKKDADYEGIWIAEPYKVGIKKEGANYIGFIIESGVEEWSPQQVKLKIEQDGNKIKSTVYMRDHTPVESGEPQMIGNNYLQVGSMFYRRLSPVFDDPVGEYWIKLVSSPNPYIEELNETTLYLRIPSFNVSFKPAIDKVIADNKDKILKTKNLIIDLRYNGGGGDGSFAELLPLLYTNPVRTISVEYLSTILNNQLFLEMVANTNFVMRMYAKRLYKKFHKELGAFVNPNKGDTNTYQRKVVYEYPKNAGTITNREIASSAEQFLLYAKQSEKVKLFGTNTWGCLDISNLVSAISPCKEFRLEYGISRSVRLRIAPEQAIDEIGIAPDYYLDETIPQYKWIEYVNEMLNQ
jgi:hypothetical protein